MAEPIIDSLPSPPHRLRYRCSHRAGTRTGGVRWHVRGKPHLSLFALIGAIVQAFFPELLPVTVLAIALSPTVAYAGKKF